MNTQMIPSRLSGCKAAIRTACLIALCVAAPVAAFVQPSSAAASTSSTKVLLAGLDLATPEGIAVARDRLHQNARQFCSQQVGSLDALQSADFTSCMDNTLMNELKQLSSNARSVIVAKSSAWPTLGEDRAGSWPRESVLETSVVAVSIADLDLLSSEGVHIAQERIHKAVRRICTQLADSQDPAQSSHYLKCMNDATTGALQEIRDAAVDAN